MSKSILIISPHTKVRVETMPTEGVEGRISALAQILRDRYDNVIIIEPSDLKEPNKENKNRYYFYAFDFIKIKNMRLGSYFLFLNPFYHLVLFKTLKKFRPSLILISHPWGVFTTWIVAKKILKCRSRIIQDSHNVESKYAKIIMRDNTIPKIIKLLYLLTIKWIEKMAVKYADLTLAISYENRKMFVDEYRAIPEKIRVVPPNLKVKERINKDDKLKKDKTQIWAVFHGIYRTVQNREAIEIIINKIAPKFMKYKNVKFVIFGKGVPKFDNKNVMSLGFVKNVYNILRECDIAVVPLVSGEGVKLKMLDYMAVGLPIVTTKKGAEGLGLVDGKHAIVVDDVSNKFIKSLEYLVENPKVRKKMGFHTRKLAKRYSPNLVREKLFTSILSGE